jgi:hypothetical protein
MLRVPALLTAQTVRADSKFHFGPITVPNDTEKGLSNPMVLTTTSIRETFLMRCDTHSNHSEVRGADTFRVTRVLQNLDFGSW